MLLCPILAVFVSRLSCSFRLPSKGWGYPATDRPPTILAAQPQPVARNVTRKGRSIERPYVNMCATTYGLAIRILGHSDRDLLPLLVGIATGLS